MTAREIAMASSRNALLKRRWLGAWLDFLVCFGILVVVAAFFEGATDNRVLYADIVLVALYFIVMESKLGWTIGKLVAGTRVVDESGGLPSIQASVIRTLLRLVEVNPLLVGGIPAGLTVNYSQARQRIGDIAAGTYVLLKKDLAKLHSERETVSVFA
jgi:uncharacterized RDD family membrane protein YckC